jgi:hypothetical protein
MYTPPVFQPADNALAMAGKVRSFDTKLSDWNDPPASDISLLSRQKSASLSRVGRPCAGGTSVWATCAWVARQPRLSATRRASSMDRVRRRRTNNDMVTSRLCGRGQR